MVDCVGLLNWFIAGYIVLRSTVCQTFRVSRKLHIKTGNLSVSLVYLRISSILRCWLRALGRAPLRRVSRVSESRQSQRVVVLSATERSQPVTYSVHLLSLAQRTPRVFGSRQTNAWPSSKSTSAHRFDFSEKSLFTCNHCGQTKRHGGHDRESSERGGRGAAFLVASGRRRAGGKASGGRRHAPRQRTTPQRARSKSGRRSRHPPPRRPLQPLHVSCVGRMRTWGASSLGATAQQEVAGG
jgi:hypothetical protein